MAGRVDEFDIQALHYLLEDHGQENVTKCLKIAMDHRVRARGVLPYVRKCLENQERMAANGGIDPDRNNWR